MEVGQKVGLYNKKTKIYQTIKRPDHSIYQALVLYQVQSGLQAIAYSNLSLLPNGLVACIISDVFVSSPIRFMTPDIPVQKSLRIQSKSGPDLHTCRQVWKGHWSTHQEAVVILVKAMTYIEDEN